jgi:hypothetical protein
MQGNKVSRDRWGKWAPKENRASKGNKVSRDNRDLKGNKDSQEKGDKQVNRLSDNCLLPLRTFRLEALLIKSADTSEI